MLVTLSTGVRIFLDVEGEGLAADGPTLRERPTLVLVHGAEVDHSFFKPWVSPLRDVAQLIYVDLIGHGRSDAGTEADWTLDSWAGAFVELCDRLGIAQPVLLGSSLGGRVVMKLALQHPERPGALILVNTVGVVRPDRRIEMLRRLGGDEAAEAARRDHESRTSQTTADYLRLCMPLMVQRPYSDDELARLQPVAPGVMARLVELGRTSEDLLPSLDELQCPVLVITGEMDPAATPEDAADITSAIGDNAELQVIPAAGHGAYRDQPEAFLAATRQFLDRLSPTDSASI